MATLTVVALESISAGIPFDAIERNVRTAMEQNPRVKDEGLVVGSISHVEKVTEGKFGDVELGGDVIAHKFTAEFPDPKDV